jgi:hypothetical protein
MDPYFPCLSPFYALDMHNFSKDKIRHKITATTKRLYSVLNYNKLGISFDDIATLKHRSVIFSFPEKLPLSFSPPKTVSWEAFRESYLYFSKSTDEMVLKNTSELHVNEYIEGVMIHLFYDPRISCWEIATQGGVGGKYSYYGNLQKDPMNLEKRSRPYFYDMFLHAFRATGDLNSIPFLESLPKNNCYVFILQHPRNKIVLQVKRPVLYLIRVYPIMKHGAIYLSPKYYEEWYIFRNMKGMIEFPKRFDFEDVNEVTTFFNNEAHGGSTTITPGIAITNEFTGELTVLKNPHYDALKIQQKTKPLIQYQYLCYRRMGESEKYLLLFPEYKRSFSRMENEYISFIKEVYLCYRNVYIYKEKPGSSNPKYEIHIRNLHKEFYLPLLRQRSVLEKPKLTFAMVLQYFDQLEPREMLYLLNWDTREHTYAS